MFFTLPEIVQWLGLTVFEIWCNLISITIFTVLLAFQVSSESTDWWLTFSPLFASDIMNCYFCVIVFIRMYLEGFHRPALLRACWSSVFLVLTIVFKYLLCRKLSGQIGLDYSEVFAPIFILLQLIAVRACQLNQ
uniref:Putative conserved plasma membrane protein n=1 Tax=Xenopsylla cheopis TaxID=163159 RepID=A0A6M2DUN8_XENCH